MAWPQPGRCRGRVSVTLGPAVGRRGGPPRRRATISPAFMQGVDEGRVVGEHGLGGAGRRQPQQSAARGRAASCRAGRPAGRPPPRPAVRCRSARTAAPPRSARAARRARRAGRPRTWPRRPGRGRRSRPRPDRPGSVCSRNARTAGVDGDVAEPAGHGHDLVAVRLDPVAAAPHRHRARRLGRHQNTARTHGTGDVGDRFARPAPRRRTAARPRASSPLTRPACRRSASAASSSRPAAARRSRSDARRLGREGVRRDAPPAVVRDGRGAGRLRRCGRRRREREIWSATRYSSPTSAKKKGGMAVPSSPGRGAHHGFATDCG